MLGLISSFAWTLTVKRRELDQRHGSENHDIRSLMSSRPSRRHSGNRSTWLAGRWIRGRLEHGHRCGPCVRFGGRVRRPSWAATGMGAPGRQAAMAPALRILASISPCEDFVSVYQLGTPARSRAQRRASGHGHTWQQSVIGDRRAGQWVSGIGSVCGRWLGVDLAAGRAGTSTPHGRLAGPQLAPVLGMASYTHVRMSARRLDRRSQPGQPESLEVSSWRTSLPSTRSALYPVSTTSLPSRWTCGSVQ